MSENGVVKARNKMTSLNVAGKSGSSSGASRRASMIPRSSAKTSGRVGLKDLRSKSAGQVQPSASIRDTSARRREPSSNRRTQEESDESSDSDSQGAELLPSEGASGEKESNAAEASAEGASSSKNASSNSNGYNSAAGQNNVAQKGTNSMALFASRSSSSSKTAAEREVANAAAVANSETANAFSERQTTVIQRNNDGGNDSMGSGAGATAGGPRDNNNEKEAGYDDMPGLLSDNDSDDDEDDGEDRSADNASAAPQPAWPDNKATFSCYPDGDHACLVCAEAGIVQTFTRLASFRNHLRKVHKGIKDPAFSTCRGCGCTFTGVPGLARHLAFVRKNKDSNPAKYKQCVEEFTPPQQPQQPAPTPGVLAAGMAATDAANAAAAASAANAANAGMGQGISDEDLVAFLSGKMVFVNKAWADNYLVMCTGLMLEIGEGRDENSRDNAMLAFTVLPGLLVGMNKLEKKVRVKDWLDKTVGEPDVTTAVLQTAYELYERFGRASGDNNNTPSYSRHSGRITKAGLTKQAKKMLRQGRPGMAGKCLSQIDKLQTDGDAEHGYVDPAMCLPMEERKSVIAALHPPARPPESGFDLPPTKPMDEEPEPLQVNAETALFYAKSMSKGTAPGADGWVDHTIRLLVAHAESKGRGPDGEDSALDKLGAALAAFANRAYSGMMGRRSVTLFTRTREVLFSKPGGTGASAFRPLGIRGVWYRYIARMAAKLTGLGVAEHLLPMQLAVGVSDGCGIGVRTAQAWYDKPPINGSWKHSRGILSVDVSNAYNTFDRAAIRDGLRLYASPLVRLFRLCYDEPCLLYHSSGEVVGVARIGVLQGDPLANAYSGIALKEPYEDMKAALIEEEASLDDAVAHEASLVLRRTGELEHYEEPAVECAAVSFADDGNLCARTGALVQMIPRVQEILAGHGLTGAMSKYVLAGKGIKDMPDDIREYVDGLGVKMSTEGLKMFGCYVGNHDFVKQQVAKVIEGHTPSDCSILRLLDDKRGGLALLSMHFNGKGQYISRHTEAELTQESHVKHNANIDAMLASLVGDDAERPLFCLLRGLPRRLGGLGIVRYGGAQTHSGVKVSRAAALKYVTENVPCLVQPMQLSQNIFTLHFGEFEGMTREDAEEEFEENMADYEAAHPKKVASACRSMSAKVNAKVERDVRAQLEKMEVDEGIRTQPRLAYFISGQNVNAAKFLAYPYGRGGHAKDDDNKCFAAAVRVRLLADPQTSGGQLAKRCLGCNKGTIVDAAGVSRTIFQHSWSHPMACMASTTGPFSSRHKAIAELVAELVKRVESARGRQVVVAREKSCRLPVAPGNVQGAQEGPYLPGYAPRMDIHAQFEGGKEVYIDVAVADPGCSSYLAAGSSVRENAAAEAREKDKRCSFKADFKGVEAQDFVPFVVEATGRVGPAAMAFLRSLDPPPGMLRRFLEQVSVICARNLGRLCLHAQGVRR